MDRFHRVMEILLGDSAIPHGHGLATYDEPFAVDPKLLLELTDTSAFCMRGIAGACTVAHAWQICGDRT